MSLLHDLTTFAFILHIGGGTVGLFSGTIALFSRKGGRLHRGAGNVFFVSMLVMAAFGGFLAVVMPDQMANLFGSAFAAYLVATGWMTVHRERAALPERIALAVALVLFAPFLLLAFQLATGAAPLFKSAVPIRGPVEIAMYTIAVVLAFAVIGDARVVFTGGISGVPRIARHLWRMCLGLTMAAGSAFTNGLPRLLPGPMHVTAIYFVPQFIPMALMIFWLIRVRLTGRYRPAEQNA